MADPRNICRPIRWQDAIETRAREALAEIRQSAQLARLELRIAPRVYLEHEPGGWVPHHIAHCPGCGGQLMFDVSEWETHGGQPTSCDVYCPVEIDAAVFGEDDELHDSVPADDFFQACRRAERWAKRWLRVVEP